MESPAPILAPWWTSSSVYTFEIVVRSLGPVTALEATKHFPLQISTYAGIASDDDMFKIYAMF